MREFMDLPREIPDMIYGEALVVKTQILDIEGHYAYCHNKSELKREREIFRIFLTILQVSKTFKNEATLVFYGNNMFALPQRSPNTDANRIRRKRRFRNLVLPQRSLRADSPFITHAALFRQIYVELPRHEKIEWRAHGNRITAVMAVWKSYLQHLHAMSGLQVLDIEAYTLELLSSDFEGTEGLVAVAEQILPTLVEVLYSNEKPDRASRRPKLLVSGRFLSSEVQEVVREAWAILGPTCVRGLPSSLCSHETVSASSHICNVAAMVGDGSEISSESKRPGNVY